MKSGMGIGAMVVSAAISIVAAATAAAQASHTLQGRVSFANGSQPPNPVRISLSLSGKRLYETFTDLSGRFSFSGLNRGKYQLTAETDGRTFETTRADAEVLGFGSAPQTFTQNIALRPIPGGGAAQRADTVAAEASDPNLPQQARDEYKKGTKRVSEDKSEEALKHFEQAIQAAPRFYLAHLSMADQYLKLRRFDEAAAAYSKAKEIRPDRAEPLNGLGATLIQQQKYDAALSHLRRVVEMGKQSSATYLYLGLGETMTGDYAAAEANLKRALELTKAPVARIYLANLYELKGEPQKAIQQLEAVLKENPDAPQTRQVRDAIEKLRKKSVKNK